MRFKVKSWDQYLTSLFCLQNRHFVNKNFLAGMKSPILIAFAIAIAVAGTFPEGVRATTFKKCNRDAMKNHGKNPSPKCEEPNLSKKEEKQCARIADIETCRAKVNCQEKEINRLSAMKIKRIGFEAEKAKYVECMTEATEIHNKKMAKCDNDYCARKADVKTCGAIKSCRRDFLNFLN